MQMPAARAKCRVREGRRASFRRSTGQPAKGTRAHRDESAFERAPASSSPDDVARPDVAKVQGLPGVDAEPVVRGQTRRPAQDQFIHRVGVLYQDPLAGMR